jgi:hypothetical protein
MNTRHASCSCGQLRIETSGEPIRVSVCHCLACQLRTGSVFGAQARFPRSNVGIEGRSSQYVRTADSGRKITFHFCPNCGSTVHYELEDFPDVIAVPIGAFAARSFSRQNSPYTSRDDTNGWKYRGHLNIPIDRCPRRFERLVSPAIRTFGEPTVSQRSALS